MGACSFGYLLLEIVVEVATHSPTGEIYMLDQLQLGWQLYAKALQQAL